MFVALKFNQMDLEHKFFWASLQETKASIKPQVCSIFTLLKDMADYVNYILNHKRLLLCGVLGAAVQVTTTYTWL